MSADRLPDRDDHKRDMLPDYRCSFCGSANTKVEWLFVGPNGVAICTECLEECNRRLAEMRRVEARRAAKRTERQHQSA